MQNYDLEVASREPSAVKVDLGSLPDHQSDTLARVLLHSVTRAFKDPAVAAEYERWRVERNTKKAAK
jgi:hypothetical protein